MTIHFERHGSRKDKKNGRPFRSFWMKVFDEQTMMTIKSCSYMCDTGTIQMPWFGQGISTVTFDPITFKEITRRVKEEFIALGEEEPWITDEDRKERQKYIKSGIKSEKRSIKETSQEETKRLYRENVKKRGN